MTQLALLEAPAPLRPVRLMRGLLVFDNEGLADAYVARHGRLYASGNVRLTVRPRATRYGWLLVGFHSGHPWALTQDRALRKMRVRDVEKLYAARHGNT